MSELIQKHDNRAAIRRKLLTSASALALTLSSIAAARAEDTDRPTLWIELGGQAENMSGQGQPFVPAFLSAYSTASILQEQVTPLRAQRPPIFSFGEEGSISFQPEDSSWVFSGGIRIGRSSNRRDVDHQTNKIHYAKYDSGVPQSGATIFTQVDFANTKVQHQQSHVILDFRAGKDIGLGLFGRDSSSTLSVGVRFAQFTSKETFDIRARPDLQFKYAHFGSVTAPEPYFHTYHATGKSSRSFRGVGPSLSWNASTPFLGNNRDGELTLDWGANAAILFGRQKAHVRHQQTGRYWPRSGFGLYSNTYLMIPTAGARDTSHSVTVPNIGGFAGISWRVENFKASLGYRADFFFGAMDTGIDARKSETLAFNGPYASISIGLGD